MDDKELEKIFLAAINKDGITETLLEWAKKECSYKNYNFDKLIADIHQE